MSKNIRQTTTFKAAPHAVYEALMDAKKHAEFTGGEAKISRLTFTQTGVPDEHYEDIKQGWKDYYWGPMKQMLEK
jgi:uncharacterized protein YndB with AHSA1/START domain